MRRIARPGLMVGILLSVVSVSPVMAQGASTPQPPTLMAPALPPATMLEGFRQPVGALLTLGYEELGEVSGVFVDVREMRDARGGRVRGLVVEIAAPGQSSREQSFVDADEIPGLMKGVDDLLAITANPTQFKSFEVRYSTRGELTLTASSSRNRGILFGVEVGRLIKTRRGALTAGEIHQLRTLFEAAAQKLATLAADK
jgi:hypothetical protein